MSNENMKLRVKTGEKDGKNYWNDCGVIFINRDDQGTITSVSVKHDMFPNVEMVAFPKREENS